jgi:hypothetical protein
VGLWFHCSICSQGAPITNVCGHLVGVLLPPITEALFQDCSTDRTVAANPLAELSPCVTMSAVVEAFQRRRESVVPELRLVTAAPLPQTLGTLVGVAAVVRTHRCWGSAFPFNVAEDVFVTCAHCVTSSSEVEIGRLVDSTFVWRTGRVLFAGPDADGLDVAVVSLVESPDFEPHASVLGGLRCGISSGDELIGVGFGGVLPWLSTFRSPLVSRGVISKVVCDATRPVLCQSSAFVWSGNSGGPALRIIGGQNCVVGMFTRCQWDVVCAVNLRRCCLFTSSFAVRCVIPMSESDR